MNNDDSIGRKKFAVVLMNLFLSLAADVHVARSRIEGHYISSMIGCCSQKFA